MTTPQEIDETTWRSPAKFVDCLHTENGQKIPVGVIAKNAPIYTDKYGEVYVPFLDDTALDFLAAQIKEMVQDKFDCIVMITGRRRIGKSNLGIQIARKVDPGFGINSIALHIDEFSSLLNKNPSADPETGLYPQAFYDEAGFGLFAKDWMLTWVKEIGKCMQVIGKKRNIVYFILPHIKKLVGDIRDEMAYFWIDLDFKYKHERGYAEVYTGIRNKHKQLIWWSPKCCFKYSEFQGQLWIDYEVKKDQFIDDVAAGKFDLGKAASKEIEKTNRAMYNLHQGGLSLEEIGLAYDMNKSTVSRRLADFRTNISKDEAPISII